MFRVWDPIVEILAQESNINNIYIVLRHSFSSLSMLAFALNKPSSSGLLFLLSVYLSLIAIPQSSKVTLQVDQQLFSFTFTPNLPPQSHTHTLLHTLSRAGAQRGQKRAASAPPTLFLSLIGCEQNASRSAARNRSGINIHACMLPLYTHSRHNVLSWPNRV